MGQRQELCKICYHYGECLEIKTYFLHANATKDKKHSDYQAYDDIVQTASEGNVACQPRDDMIEKHNLICQNQLSEGHPLKKEKHV